MTNRHVVIMAGGSGTRFWPASRARLPKQFLKIGADESMLRQTVARVIEDHPIERIWVVVGAEHVEHARAILPELPDANLLVEPVGRNTAPCIAWATATIGSFDPLARVAVLPADHHIADAAAFRADLAAAFDAAAEHIVLFGIVPDRPETGYGYIQKGARAGGTDDRPVYAVARFVEKPDAPTAERYLASGDYLWNSGMFVFPARLMLSEIEALIPEVGVGVRRILEGHDVDAVYAMLPSISIDYAVMERSSRTLVVQGRFAWSDVGSWDAAMDIYPADAGGNVVIGDVTLVDVKNSFVQAEGGRMVAVVGLDDVVVVDTPDALLVIRRGRSQAVRSVVEALRRKGKQELL